MDRMRVQVVDAPPRVGASTQRISRWAIWMGWTASDDEVGLVEIDGVNPDQGDRIRGREMNHGIPRDDIIVDELLQCVPTRKSISVDVDNIMLRRRTANS